MMIADRAASISCSRRASVLFIILPAPWFGVTAHLFVNDRLDTRDKPLLDRTGPPAIGPDPADIGVSKPSNKLA